MWTVNSANDNEKGSYLIYRQPTAITGVGWGERLRSPTASAMGKRVTLGFVPHPNLRATGSTGAHSNLGGCQVFIFR
jgi:hypothetical protein